MKILVTGGNGQLGNEIRYLSTNSDYHFIFCDLEEMDLSSTISIQNYLKAQEPEFVISCGAYTAVDKAEDEPELVYRINAEAPKTIAEYCKSNKVRLIHISTDYVFDGEFDRPINEEDQPNPQSVYDQTKLEGETFVQSILNDSYIIRTSWVYSEFGKNFVKTMLRIGSENDEINVVSDQYGSPTWARDLANVILHIVSEISSGNDKPGIYHFSNEGQLSWYDFANEIMKMGQINCKINPIKTDQFPTNAKRPAYGVLDKSKIKSFLNAEIPRWDYSLRNYFNS